MCLVIQISSNVRVARMDANSKASGVTLSENETKATKTGTQGHTNGSVRGKGGVSSGKSHWVLEFGGLVLPHQWINLVCLLFTF